MTSSYPSKNGSYYDPRFTDVLPNGDVVALDDKADKAESKLLVQMINNIRKARTVSIA